MHGCVRARQGGYVEPGPGGDPIRNPGVLPTGKNIHALDPQSIPTAAAVKSARIVVERLLEVQRQEAGGAWPETVAVVLWGTDNLKTYGESRAQVRTHVPLLFITTAPGPRCSGSDPVFGSKLSLLGCETFLIMQPGEVSMPVHAEEQESPVIGKEPGRGSPWAAPDRHTHASSQQGCCTAR